MTPVAPVDMPSPVGEDEQRIWYTVLQEQS